MVYNINLNTTNIPNNLHFYIDENMKTEINYSNNTLEYEGFIGYNEQTKTRTQTIYWNWPFESGETEAEINANDIDDSRWMGRTISLGVNVTGKQVTQAPAYLANVAVPGTYVDYVDNNGNIINCVVLYNDSTNGLQVISTDTVRKVKIGGPDSYNRAIIALNKYAMDYLNTDLAYNARCVGSKPMDKNYPNNLTGNEKLNKMYTAPSQCTYMENYNGKFWSGESDTDFTRNNTDVQTLQRIGLVLGEDDTYNTRYWLASYRIYIEPNRCYYMLRFIDQNGNINSTGIFYIDSDTSLHNCGPEFGFRPVFYLNQGVRIVGGEGTENSPYQLIENQE